MFTLLLHYALNSAHLKFSDLERAEVRLADIEHANKCTTPKLSAVLSRSVRGSIHQAESGSVQNITSLPLRDTDSRSSSILF